MSYDKEVAQTRPAIEQAVKQLRDGNLALHGTQFDQYRLSMVLAATILEVMLEDTPQPIDMILYCPACCTQHIDAPTPCDMGVGCQEAGSCYTAGHGEPDRCNAWTNPPHRSHLCASCGHIWRPADVPTNGVQAIATRGKVDTQIIDVLSRDGWQYPFENNPIWEIAHCYVDGDRDTGLVHIDGALDAVSLSRLAAWLRRPVN